MRKSALTLGIDLGGTKIDIGVVDASGKILRRELINTRPGSPEVVVNDICHTVEKLTANDTFLAAGIGIAGQIDNKTGVVHFAPNLPGWASFPLQEELERRLKIPVRATNDVRAAAYGEWLYGEGRGCSDLICLFIGTGIGAGIVSGGKMLTGNSNAAGEVGHITLDVRGPLCTCGNKGCFEALAGGWAIARRAQQLAIEDPLAGKLLLGLVGGTIEELDARKVFEAYRAKSAVVIKVVEEMKEALVAGVASLINSFNPQKIILGGGVINGSPELLKVILEGVPKRALKACVEFVEIVPSQLKGDASVAGASAFALNILNID